MTEEEPQPDASEPDPDSEALVAAIERQIGLDKQDLLLLKILPELVDKLRDMNQADEPDRVRFAANRGLIAVGERIARICRRDLAADKG